MGCNRILYFLRNKLDYNSSASKGSYIYFPIFSIWFFITSHHTEEKLLQQILKTHSLKKAEEELKIN